MEPLVLHLPDGRVLEAQPKLLIGRDPDCGCPLLEDPAVSTRHAMIDRDEGGWFVEDLKSTNGTWVNEHRIKRRTPIAPGDVVRVGGTRIRVARGLPAGAAPLPPTAPGVPRQ
ncbi:MAG TPA: FHA domain-containing protein [Thermoanaerobaculia bacterium]|nr:FHA domain-containing protein [Thermoanaerobaculia bacterium]